MRIGVFCSGGDAPGMNACVRAVVRTGIVAGHEIVGIRRGWQGVLDRDLYTTTDGHQVMTLRSVSNIVKLGGTILRSNRSEEFRTEQGQQRAAKNLQEMGIDALIPIGGDGTFRGATALARFWPGRIVGCPGTIDNDLVGSDFTIGFSTAMNTAVEAVDKLRDTAESHEMLFLVEVMGRHSGYIALYTALAGGAESVCLPETLTEVPRIIEHLNLLKTRGKSSIMVIVAEGDESGGADVLHEQLRLAQCPYNMRVVVLGHLQRGGSPTAEDRLLASRLGEAAVRGIERGLTGVMAGEQRGEITYTPFSETYAQHRSIPLPLLELLHTLAN